MTTRILAIDTATEQCSVALRTGGTLFERIVPTARGHADLVLNLTHEVLQESGTQLRDLDVLAFGRGPGSFTGVRIAVGVIQGLGLASGKPVVGVSNLAAVAQRMLVEHSLPPRSRMLVCMDARMKEAYWSVFEVGPSGLVIPIGGEHVTAPDALGADVVSIPFAAGTALRAYPELKARLLAASFDESALPRAREIVTLADHEFASGRFVSARDAQPVYIRDQVAWPST